jgi:hypothetical protein
MRGELGGLWTTRDCWSDGIPPEAKRIPYGDFVRRGGPAVLENLNKKWKEEIL